MTGGRALPRAAVAGMAAVVAALGATAATAATCSASAQAVTFGAYDPLSSASRNDGRGTIDIACDAPANYTVALDPGINPGPAGERQMAGPSGNLLTYNLYSDAGLSSVWGDGSGSTGMVSGSATRSSFVVYGSIPAEQKVTPGSYSDRVVITISFN